MSELLSALTHVSYTTTGSRLTTDSELRANLQAHMQDGGEAPGFFEMTGEAEEEGAELREERKANQRQGECEGGSHNSFPETSGTIA